MSNMDVKEIIGSMDPYERLMLYGAGLSGKDLKTKVKMQKLLFFCTQALPEIFGDDLVFEAHKKGPYSQELEELMIEMEDKGLINLPDCSPTEIGNMVCSEIVPKEPLKSVIKNYKDLITVLNEDELLTLIYITFPKYQENSEEWDRLESIRVETAASMLKKQAISFSKALEISGMNSDSFVQYLNDRKIRWRDA